LRPPVPLTLHSAHPAPHTPTPLSPHYTPSSSTISYQPRLPPVASINNLKMNAKDPTLESPTPLMIALGLEALLAGRPNPIPQPLAPTSSKSTDRDGLEALLAGSVEELQLDLLAVELDGPELKVDADRGRAVHVCRGLRVGG
jgi:hypothetical protein